MPPNIRIPTDAAGKPASYALADFPTAEDARDWLDGVWDPELLCGTPMLNGSQLRADLGPDRAWICPKCTTPNADTKNVCTHCQLARPAGAAAPEPVFNNTLVAKGLNSRTTEDSVRAVFEPLVFPGALYSVRICLLNDGNRQVDACFLDFVSVEEATTALRRARTARPTLQVDGRCPRLEYAAPGTWAPPAPKNIVRPPPAAAGAASAGTGGVTGSAAGGATPMKTATTTTTTQQQPMSMEFSTMEPDPEHGHAIAGTNFVYEAPISVYRDSQTNFLYDHRTKHYMNGNTGQFFVYDAASGQYFTASPPKPEGQDALSRWWASQHAAGGAPAVSSMDVSASLSAAEEALAAKKFNIKKSKALLASRISVNLDKWSEKQKTLVTAPTVVSDKAAVDKGSLSSFAPVGEVAEDQNPYNVPPEPPVPDPVPAAPEPAPVLVPESVAAPEVVPAAAAVAAPVSPSAAAAAAAAAAYFMDDHLASPPPPERPSIISPANMVIADAELERVQGNLCLLCQRKFNSIEMLTKHQQLSDLHKTNLANAREERMKQLWVEYHTAMAEEVEKEESRKQGFRDRAAERRKLYNQPKFAHLPDDRRFPEGRPMEQEVVRYDPGPTTVRSAPVTTIGEENIGNRMLKGMGWSEGQGLGRNNTGMVNPIQAHMRAEGAGLGLYDETVPFREPGDSYKETVTKRARMRLSKALQE